jgi:metal-responsive CopG/Arc/MetJ family transcriptional regulator
LNGISFLLIVENLLWGIVMSKVKYVNISIPKPLYERLEKALKDSGYRSPTEYIIFLIRKHLADLESDDLDRRLKALGYK